jgi:hypothetical protein
VNELAAEAVVESIDICSTLKFNGSVFVFGRNCKLIIYKFPTESFDTKQPILTLTRVLIPFELICSIPFPIPIGVSVVGCVTRYKFPKESNAIRVGDSTFDILDKVVIIPFLSCRKRSSPDVFVKRLVIK